VEMRQEICSDAVVISKVVHDDRKERKPHCLERDTGFAVP
jgi:hypothetical protein